MKQTQPEIEILYKVGILGRYIETIRLKHSSSPFSRDLNFSYHLSSAERPFTVEMTVLKLFS